MSNTVEDIAQWFKLAVPEPTPKNQFVQIGVHIEEFTEMLDALGGKDSAVRAGVHMTAEAFKNGEVSTLQEDIIVDRQELLDSLCDQIVTAIGIGHMYGLDVVAGLAEVNRSNYSKFVDGKPIFNDQGKIAKGPAYFKPDLTKFV